MKPPWREIALTSVLTSGFLLLLGQWTNSLDTHKFSWDFRYYIDMAERGLDSGALVAPFAYRFLWTELVRLLHSTGLSIDLSFASIAYLGVFGELVLLFVFLRRWGIEQGPALWATAWTALAYCNAKFLLFDVYRPESLAYPILVLAMTALVSGSTAWCVALSLIGLQVREFLVIPLILAAVAAVWPRLGPRPEASPRPARAVAILLLTVTALALPRLLLPVAWSAQSLDLQHNARAWRGLIGFPLRWARDLNLLFCILSYGLPVWIFTTRARAAEVRGDLGPRLPLLTLYTLLTLILTVYGGTDVFRFVAYLFIPQAVVLALLAARAHPAERLYALIAVAVFNRAYLPIPMSDLDHFLDFYGGWGERLSAAALARTIEAMAWIAGAILLRVALARRTRASTSRAP